ncbi:unnamed protein product, partial [Polarella glacialis]
REEPSLSQLLPPSAASGSGTKRSAEAPLSCQAALELGVFFDAERRLGPLQWPPWPLPACQAEAPVPQPGTAQSPPASRAAAAEQRPKSAPMLRNPAASVSSSALPGTPADEDAPSASAASSKQKGKASRGPLTCEMRGAGRAASALERGSQVPQRVGRPAGAPGRPAPSDGRPRSAPRPPEEPSASVVSAHEDDRRYENVDPRYVLALERELVRLRSESLRLRRQSASPVPARRGLPRSCSPAASASTSASWQRRAVRLKVEGLGHCQQPWRYLPGPKLVRSAVAAQDLGPSRLLFAFHLPAMVQPRRPR